MQLSSEKYNINDPKSRILIAVT